MALRHKLEQMENRVVPSGIPLNGTLIADGPMNAGGSGRVRFFNPSGGAGGYRYSFDFGNDGTFEVIDSTTPNATVPGSYFRNNAGSVQVAGRITDAVGAASLQRTSIPIGSKASTFSVTGPNAIALGTAALFRVSVNSPNGAGSSAGIQYSWTFGDGQRSNKASPSHVYRNPGSYTAIITVTDSNGGQSSVNIPIRVALMGPTPPTNFIVTANDRIPNFGANPTVIAAASGAWSNPSTWSTGQVPAAGDVVSIGAGVVVTYDKFSDGAIKTVAIQDGGSLRFRTDINTRLTVINLLVLAGGELQIGTQTTPIDASVKAEVIFADVPLDLANDPEQFGNGLIALGKVTIYGAVKSETFVRLAVEPLAGATTLTLATPVTGWRVGDRIELPDSRMLYGEIAPDDPLGTYTPQHELVTVTAISADGRTITLSQQLQFAHKGARDGNNVIDFMPHVANLSRNVVVRSASAQGVRGHTLFTGRADVNIRYAQFSGLGRTTVNFLDNTTFDAQGNVTHVGTNQTARYSVNFRSLVGPMTPQANGYQFSFSGNSVFCPLDPMTFRWGIALHESSYGLIQDNVLYNWAGAGIAADTGGEVNNVIAHNLITRISGFSVGIQRGDERGFGGDFAYEGSGMWFRGPSNFVRDNVISDSRLGVSYWAYGEGAPVRIPVVQGADISQQGQYQLVWFNQQSIREFARNEIYGGWTNIGLTIWALGNQNGAILNPNQAESVVRDLKMWHVYAIGYYNYDTDRLTFDGLIMRGDWSLMLQGTYGGKGLISGDYTSRNFKVVNANIQGLYNGIDIGISGRFGASPSAAQVIKDSYLRNYLNITFNAQASTGGPESPEPRTTIIQNVRFDNLNVPQRWDLPPQSHIRRQLILFDNANYVIADDLFVIDYNGVPGDDFQVFYPEQAANSVLPRTTYYPGSSVLLLVGCPEAGMTNAQAWQRYGIAYAGTIAPPDAVSRPGIVGLTVARTLASITVNDGKVQRSMVNDLEFRFNQLVSFPNGAATAFQVSGPGGSVQFEVDLSRSDAWQTTARLRFPNGNGGYRSLDDGNYTLTVLSSQVSANGLPLDGDGDGQVGGNLVYSFWRLFGDVDGNRTVNTTDLAQFQAWFGNVGQHPFDANNDNVINAIDFMQFRHRFGSVI